MPDYGYAGEILKVDLTNRKVIKEPSAPYTQKFIGGHGLGVKLYWDMVPAEAKATDPENAMICASGPISGFSGFAGSRWKVCAKTTLNTPESFNYCNLGERWGTYLKYAGYDALAVQGKAQKPVYLFIHDGKVEFKDAGHLKGLSTFETADIIKKECGDGVSVLSIGAAGENLVPFSIVQSEGASGSGGMGMVMGSKNLKAIAVAGDKKPVAAHPDQVKALGDIIRNNRPKTAMPAMWGIPGNSKSHACWGCGIGCTRESYTADGKQYKALCQATMVYEQYGAFPRTGPEKLLGTRLCDGYGMDTSVMQSMVEFLGFCFKDGIITEQQTGLPLTKIGSTEFSEKFMHMVAHREGFGAVLANGIVSAAKEIGPKAVAILPKVISTRGSEKKDYDPRLLMITAITYATEPRRAIQQLHEVSSMAMAWAGMGPAAKPGSMFSSADFRKVAEIIWGSAIAADFSTWEGKALAAKKMQDRVFFKESMVICDLRWTMTQTGRILGTAQDTVTEEQVYSAVTGKEIDRAGVAAIGERIFNQQRAILLKQGWGGRNGDMLLDYFFTAPFKKGELFFNVNGTMPGKDGEVISKVGETVDKEKFEQLKTEYYGYRSWDTATGYPTKAKLKELGLDDVANDLGKRGLTK
jgi:aldehyde:ferredoxin oxidoreductase